MRLLCVAVLAGIVMTMLWTSHQHRSSLTTDYETPDFGRPGAAKDRHGKTVVDPQGINADRPAGGGSEAADSEEVADRLKAAEQEAKGIAQAKAPLKPDSPRLVVGVGSSADGQDAALKQHDADGEPKGAAAGGSETEEEHKAEQELRSILKRAPGMTTNSFFLAQLPKPDFSLFLACSFTVVSYRGWLTFSSPLF